MHRATSHIVRTGSEEPTMTANNLRQRRVERGIEMQVEVVGNQLVIASPAVRNGVEQVIASFDA